MRDFHVASSPLPLDEHGESFQRRESIFIDFCSFSFEKGRVWMWECTVTCAVVTKMLIPILWFVVTTSIVSGCNFYVNQPEGITQEVLHSNKREKTCVIVFPTAALKRVNFTISFLQIENTSDRYKANRCSAGTTRLNTRFSCIVCSCSTSFIKVYTMVEGVRHKRYHACSSPHHNSTFSMASQETTVITTLQTQFKLTFFYEGKCDRTWAIRLALMPITLYDDSLCLRLVARTLRSVQQINSNFLLQTWVNWQTSNSTKLRMSIFPKVINYILGSLRETVFLIRNVMLIWRQLLPPIAVCLQQEKIPCESTRKCMFNDTSTLCNSTKYLCIDGHMRCNGVFDCPHHDFTDETRC